MKNWEAIVGGNVRRLREERGLTQQELAQASRLTLRHLGRIERCDGNPTVTVLGRIATALRVHPSALFDS
jgi:transcriptional regulator with XRE-family HTH domain